MNFKIGSNITIDLSFLGPSANRVQFKIPNAVQEIHSIGTIEIGSRKFVRYYFFDREGFVEVEFRAGNYQACRIFVRDMEEFPLGEQEWQKWKATGSGRIGSPSVLHGDYEYRRLWNSSDEWVRPVLLIEDLLSGDSVDSVRVEKLGMMYYRIDSPPLGSRAREFRELLILLMDGGGVETYVGVDYDAARING